MSAAKKIEALLARLSANKPDFDAIDEAVGIIIAYVAKLPRKSDLLTCYELPIAERARPFRLLTATRGSHLRHGVFCAGPGEFFKAFIGDVDGIYDPYKNAAGGVTIPEDAGFTWPWEELAPSLVAVLRAIPSRARTRRPITCPHCRQGVRSVNTHRWRLVTITHVTTAHEVHVFECTACGFHWGADHFTGHGAGAPPTAPDSHRPEGASRWDPNCPAWGFRIR